MGNLLVRWGALPAAEFHTTGYSTRLHIELRTSLTPGRPSHYVLLIVNPASEYVSIDQVTIDDADPMSWVAQIEPALYDIWLRLDVPYRPALITCRDPAMVRALLSVDSQGTIVGLAFEDEILDSGESLVGMMDRIAAKMQAGAADLLAGKGVKLDQGEDFTYVSGSKSASGAFKTASKSMEVVPPVGWGCLCCASPIGKKLKCGGCKVARFCDTACMKKEWKRHKTECKKWGARWELPAPTASERLPFKQDTPEIVAKEEEQRKDTAANNGVHRIWKEGSSKQVELHGLQGKPKLNGRIGEIDGRMKVDRYVVVLDGAEMLIKGANLRILDQRTMGSVLRGDIN